LDLLLVNEGIFFSEAYYPPQSSFTQLLFEPSFIVFRNKELNKQHSATVQVTAKNGDFNITNIKCSHPFFDINPKSFSLAEGQSIELTINYFPIDSIYSYSKFVFVNDLCPINLYAAGTYPKYKKQPPTIKVTHPNGGEIFVAGIDTLITWDGIPKDDLVQLEFSIDNGKTWKEIDTARGLEYKWKKVPRPSSNQCLVKVLQLSSANHLHSVRTLWGHSDFVRSISISPDGQYIASGSLDKTINIWRANDGSLVRTINAGSSYIYSVCFSPDGQYIASSGVGNIKLWKTNSGNLVRNFKGNDNNAWSINYSPDGEYIASGGDNGSIKIWRVNDGSLIQTLIGHNEEVRSVCFSPNGQYIASSGDDNTIKIWRVNDGSLVRAILGQTDIVSSVCFSPDGENIAAGGLDKIIKIWRVSDGSLVRSFLGHNDWVYSVCFSPDWEYIASGSCDKTVKIWTITEKYIQEDISNKVFSIVEPKAESADIDLGLCPIGKTKDTIVTDFIKNTGNGKFRVDSIYIKGADRIAFSLVSGLPKYFVESNNTYSTELRFKPNRIGPHSATIIIITQSDTLRHIIRGEGVNEMLALENQIIDFGKVDLGSEKDTLLVPTIKNTGSVPMTITETRHSYPNDKDFSTIAGGGSFTIQPNETKTMDLRFRPSDAGRTSGTLEFHYNGVGSPLIVQLFGEGVKKYPLIQTQIENFSDLFCYNEETKELKISNMKGASNLAIKSIKILGSNSTEFELNALFPLIIEPDSIISIPITFKPQTPGYKFANIEIISNAFTDTVISIPLTARKENVDFTLSTTEVFLGNLKYLESTEKIVKIKNVGTVQTSYTVSVTGNLKISDTFFTLLPNEEKEITISYSKNVDDFEVDEILTIQDNTCNFAKYVKITGLTFTAKAQLKTIEKDGYPGDEIKVPIILDNEEYLQLAEVGTIDVEMEFNPTLLYTKNLQMERIDDRRAKVTIKDLPANKKAGEIMGEVDFVVGLGNAESCDLILQNAKANGGQADISMLSGKFQLKGICREGGARLINPLSKAGITKIAPNPAENSVEIEISLIEQGITELLLYNTMGEVVKTVMKSENPIRGTHTFQLNTTDLGTGQYILQLRTPTYVESKILKILK
jgi:WD40 repeat protein